MSDGLSRAEFDGRMGGLEKLIGQRFDQNDATNRRIEEKVDETNGRVRNGELQGAEHETKIRNLEAAVFRYGRIPPAPPPIDDDAKGITRRDVAMIGIGAGGLAMLVGGAWKILPFLLAGPKP